MHQLAPLIYDLAVMLGVAGIVMVVFQYIHQPLVLGYLVAGMIVGPYTPPHGFITDITSIKTLSELGVIFLMFSLGLEFSFEKLMKVGLPAMIIGVIEVAAMVIVGFLLGHALGWPRDDSLFLGAALSISSTTIIVKAIQDLNLKTKHFAHLAVGILIVEDLIAVLLLVALSTVVVTGNVFSFDIAKAGLRLLLVVSSWVFIGYFLVPPIFKFMAKIINQEILTILAVALCLFLSCFAVKLGYSPALGAFIMGAVLAETLLIKRIETLMFPIRDVFAAVFFVSVGMLINPHVIYTHWHLVLLLTLVTIVGKLTITTFAALISRRTKNEALCVGFSMAQIGEFSFIIAAMGLTLNVTDETFYPLIVAVASITTFTTPYFIRFANWLTQG
jgi:CPA2 family monovalent cation:H+ antiporter-2